MGERVLRALTGPIQIRPGEAGRLIGLVPSTPERVAKLRTIPGRRWPPKEKYWTVPHTDGTIAHLLALFAGEPVAVEPSLRPVRARTIGSPRPNRRSVTGQQQNKR